jgi:hypothetical protein
MVFGPLLRSSIEFGLLLRSSIEFGLLLRSSIEFGLIFDRSERLVSKNAQDGIAHFQTRTLWNEWGRISSAARFR